MRSIFTHLNDTYNGSFENRLFNSAKYIKVKTLGFKPRSVAIREMIASGELSLEIIDQNAVKYLGEPVSDNDLNIPVPLLNIKNMDMDDLVKAVRRRGLDFDEKYNQALTAYQKRQAELQAAISYYQGLSNNSVVSDNSEVTEK